MVRILPMLCSRQRISGPAWSWPGRSSTATTTGEVLFEHNIAARWRSVMKTTNPLDAARIELLLSELRLPAINLIWAKLAEQSDKEGWPAARFLAALAEHEIAERNRRRIEPHLAEARC